MRVARMVAVVLGLLLGAPALVLPMASAPLGAPEVAPVEEAVAQGAATADRAAASSRADRARRASASAVLVAGALALALAAVEARRGARHDDLGPGGRSTQPWTGRAPPSERPRHHHVHAVVPA